MNHNFTVNDFIGSLSNDGSAFAFGTGEAGKRLVLNFKNVSAFLVTKSGNFDLHELELSDTITEFEFNGVLFKRVE
jgi:hypothetical protein